MIKSLQSLRFFAILMVFFTHLSYLKGNIKYGGFYDRFLYDGYSGVSFFLILSGFVISYNYYSKINSYSRTEVIEFIKKRLRKIYPLHILTFLISIVLIIRIVINSPLKMLIMSIFNITLTQSFIPLGVVYFSFNGVSWYLSVILFCYILTPFIICNIKKIEIRNIKLGMIMIVIYILQVLYVLIFKDSKFNHWLIYINPIFRLLDYINGLLLGVILLKRKDSDIVVSIKNTAYELGSILMFFIAYYFYPYIDQSFRWGIYYVPFAIFIIFVFSRQGGYISKVLENKYILYLGNISFEFYMIHQLVIEGLLKVIDNDYAIIIATLSFIISFIASVILNKTINNKIFNYHKSKA